MKSGKKKLAYGSNPDDAYAILQMRLAPEEMASIIKEDCKKIPQREMRNYIDDLG